VISIHTGKSTTGGKMTVGNLNADESLVLLLKQAFTQTDYHLNFCENMDAWLKCHAAFVLPIVLACYSSDGDLRKVAWDSRRLNQMLNAIDNAYRIVKAAGYPIIPPENEGFLQGDRPKFYWLLKLMAATPIGKLAASNHAMSARKEMRRLYDDFCLLKQKAEIETPDWDEMAKNMEKC
jgi:2-dehydropantoate 2-reductase